MSVMLVDIEKSGSLIEGICQFAQMWNSGRFLDHTNTGKLYHDSVSKFIRKVYHANISTYNSKYEEDAQIFDIIKVTGEPMGKYQVLKTLQCLHYNIEEEYFPSGKKLLEQLQIMINEIIYNLVTEQEEYKNAVWG